MLGAARPTYSISQTTALMGAAGMGGLAGAGSYYALGNTLSYPYNYLAIGGISAVTGLISWGILNSFTPAGRLSSAKKKLVAVSANPMAIQSFNEDRVFFDALQEVYITDDLWLISGFNEMSVLLDESRSALELTERARSEAARSNLLEIVHECNVISPHLRRMISNLAAGLKRIRTNPEYVKQVKIHKEMLAAQAKLAVQQQVANAQTQMAHAQMHTAFRK